MPLPPVSADRNYSRGLSRSLALAGADVTFMALASEEKNLDAYRCECPEIVWIPVEDVPKPVFSLVLSRLPLAAARFATTAFRNALRSELSRLPYDCVIFDHYAMGWAASEISGQRTHCLVYVSHNYEIEVTAAIARDFRGNLAKKIFLYANAWKTARIEKKLTRDLDLLTVNTDEDGAKYLTLHPKRAPITLRPGFAGFRRPERVIHAATPRRVIVLGTFQWVAKQMNLERFLEAADGPFARAGIEMEIVGDVSKELVERWQGRLHATKFRGFVDDLQTCFDQARMGLVIEATGGGFKHKTLDYLFGRLPVAALAPALSGIDGKVREHFIVEHEVGSLIKSIICGAIDDLDRLNAMQRDAFTAAYSRFDWEAHGKVLLSAIETVLK
jgi:hypothetical protein